MIEVRACAREEIISQYEEISRACWPVPDSMYVPLTALRFGGCAVGAFDGGRMVGYTVVLSAGDGAWVFYSTAVLEEYRRQGIGTRLKMEAFRAAKERGIDRVYTIIDPSSRPALAFHLDHLGERVVERVPDYFGPGAPRIIAVWEP